MPFRVSFSVVNWRDEVLRAWGEAWGLPEIAYEFTNRTFDDSGPFGSFYERPS
jgi:hypothetical protein